MPDGQLTRPNGAGTMRRRQDPRFGDRPVVMGQERSVGELVGSLSSDLSLLMRQEMALAKVEVRQSVSHLGKGAARVGVAARQGVDRGQHEQHVAEATQQLHDKDLPLLLHRSPFSSTER